MSIYNIALYAALAAVCGLFAAGLYNFALVLLKVPSSRTTKAIKAVAARNRPSAAGFKNTYNDISLFVSRFIRLNEFKKKELADSLKIANISMSPELFTARALVRSAGIMLLSVPFFFFLPIIGLLVIVLAVLMYRSKATQKLNNIAYALIIGGALGNLFDRLWHGFVVDMIDFYVGDWHFATFNLADSAICVGAALIVLEGFLPKSAAKEQA